MKKRLVITVILALFAVGCAQTSLKISDEGKISATVKAASFKKAVDIAEGMKGKIEKLCPKTQIEKLLPEGMSLTGILDAIDNVVGMVRSHTITLEWECKTG